MERTLFNPDGTVTVSPSKIFQLLLFLRFFLLKLCSMPFIILILWFIWCVIQCRKWKKGFIFAIVTCAWASPSFTVVHELLEWCIQFLSRITNVNDCTVTYFEHSSGRNKKMGNSGKTSQPLNDKFHLETVYWNSNAFTSL